MMKKDCWLILNFNYNLKRMTSILCFLVWISITQAAVYNKHTSLQPTNFTSSDYLLSTLGIFRYTLNAQNCQLKIQNFVRNEYRITGYYPRQVLPSCAFLFIANNTLFSNNNDVILRLNPSQIKNTYDQVFVTIDEMGIIRINGVFNDQFESSAENWISLFRTPQQYIYTISRLSVTLYNSLSFIQNTANWGFSATNGSLRIFRIENVSKIVRYNYTSFTMMPNNLLDYNSNSIPYADFKNFNYYPACTETGFINNFQGPFVFVIHPYWPQLRVLDRSGYQIITIRYPNADCKKSNQNYLLGIDSCNVWFCPQYTFQFNGNCVAVCPSPYFHQIGRNNINRCVLNCQNGFNINMPKRTCSCDAIKPISCPQRLRETPFLCLCPGGTFFNSFNQIIQNNTNYCFNTCGPYLYAHRDGLCVPCPKNCISCRQSSNSFGYLNCIGCIPGYSLNEQRYCVRMCNTSLITLFNEVCNSCKIQDCFNCSSDGLLCFECFKPYSLFNSSCSKNCPRGFKTKFNSSIGFICEMIPACSISAITINSINNQSQCFCLKNGNPTFSKGCQQQKAEDCKMSQYYDINLSECLACPISCLTCLLDNNANIQCTSCHPQYILYISISVSRGHYCQRKSILSVCSGFYDKESQVCMIKNVAQIAETNRLRNSCFIRIPNCLLCLSGSSSTCGLCSQGFYLYQGLCSATCLKSTLPYEYQRVCIPVTLSDCLSQSTENSYWIFNKNEENRYSDGFFYMVSLNYQAQNNLNDPLGSIFIYSDRNRNTIIQITKEVNIASSYQKCQLCRKGFGLTLFGNCMRCSYPCLQCAFVANDSMYCVNCQIYYKLNSFNHCQLLETTQLPCLNNQFRNENRLCENKCRGFYRQDHKLLVGNKSYDINCTKNCPTGYQITSVNSSFLTCSKQTNADQQEVINFMASSIIMNDQLIYMLISTDQLTFKEELNISFRRIQAKNERLMLQSSPKLYRNEFGFFIIDKSSASTALIIQLEALNIYSISGSGNNIYLGNTVYGIQNKDSSFINTILEKTSNLYTYGRAFIFLAFLATLLFFAKDLNYKTDNLFIMFSVTYIVLPSINLLTSNANFTSYSFLYGFSWSTLLELFSSPRYLTKSSNWFPNSYVQKVGNNSHYLLYVDNNFLRNCWSILLVLIVILSIYGALRLFMELLSIRKSSTMNHTGNICLHQFLYHWKRTGFHSQNLYHTSKINFFLFFFLENAIIGLSFYAVLNITNPSWQLARSEQRFGYKIASIVTLTIIVAYSIIRFYVNKLGGMYCLKRIMIGIIFGLASSFGGTDKNIVFTLTFLILNELVFIFLRYRYEFRTNYLFNLLFKRKSNATQEQPEAIQFWTMIIEEALIIIHYASITLINKLNQISVLVIWIIINIFMISLFMDFVDFIIDYWKQTYANEKRESNKFYRMIRSIWDHDISTKSLAETID